MLINFFLVQFVPGGPVEQIISDLESRTSFIDNIGSGSSELLTNKGSSKYKGGAGLPQDFITELETQFGFDKPPVERFFAMMRAYLVFDFGESYFRSISVIELIKEKMPVSISLGLWSTILAYLISIPLGIKKAVNDGTNFDNWTSIINSSTYVITPECGCTHIASLSEAKLCVIYDSDNVPGMIAEEYAPWKKKYNKLFSNNQNLEKELISFIG